MPFRKSKTCKKSPLKQELIHLREKIRREEDYLNEVSQSFFESGGICCPSCGVPGYDDRLRKQEIRHVRLRQLEEKINASRTFNRGSKIVFREIILAWVRQDNIFQPMYVNDEFRKSFLTKKFSIGGNRLNAFLDGKMGLRPIDLRKVGTWCRENMGYQFPHDVKGVNHVAFSQIL